MAKKAKANKAKSKVGKQSRAGTDVKDRATRRAPKKKCCVSSTRCDRCPLRMLKEGTLPPGYTVKKRRLVAVREAA